MTSKAELAELLAQLAQVLAEREPEQPKMPEARPMLERVLLTVEEAGERLRLGKTKTYALVKSGEIESVLIGRLRRIHVDAIKAYAARLVAQQNISRAAA
jgi:excisionase family DNA binding protein